MGADQLVKALGGEELENVKATKAEPNLVVAAVEKAGGGDAVMVGDSTWDCEAAKRAGLDTIAVLTGGFSAAELRDAACGKLEGHGRQARHLQEEARLREDP